MFQNMPSVSLLGRLLRIGARGTRGQVEEATLPDVEFVEEANRRDVGLKSLTGRMPELLKRLR
jgi:hypothetical protein